MKCFTILASLIACAVAYPVGAPSCGPPDHSNGESITAEEAGVSVTQDGTRITVTSGRKFKGILVFNENGLSYTKSSPGTVVSDICRDGERSAVSHTSNVRKESAWIDMDCSRHPGLSIVTTIMIVYSFNEPFVEHRENIDCPGDSSPTDGLPLT